MEAFKQAVDYHPPPPQYNDGMRLEAALNPHLPTRRNSVTQPNSNAKIEDNDGLDQTNNHYPHNNNNNKRIHGCLGKTIRNTTTGQQHQQKQIYFEDDMAPLGNARESSTAKSPVKAAFKLGTLIPYLNV